MSYFKVKDGNAVAFDIDDTLVMWSHIEGYEGELVNIETNGFIEQAIPNKHNIELLKKLKKRNYSIIVWSAGNSNWAESVIKALKLESYVDVIMPKLDSYIDDLQDPYDKLGYWQYFDLNGKYYRKTNNKFQNYEGEEKDVEDRG